MDVTQSLESMLEDRMKLQSASQENAAAQSADMPAGMRKARDVSVDELMKEMNRVPLFMTSLDETDGEGGENIELEAMKALAYEGTRSEIAQNFREQGTELIRLEKRYSEAREFYSKAIHALRSPAPEPDPEQGPSVIEIDEEAEEAKEKAIMEVCLVNRALCNLEMKNYGQCNRDCAAALQLNAKNVKAWYRAASACLALDKVVEAIDACESGLNYDSQNAALKTLMTRSEKRRDHLAALDATRKEREDQARLEKTTLRAALKSRGVAFRETDKPPEMPEAAIVLDDPIDPKSNLSFPVMLLYPLHAQTDFIKSFGEEEALNEHLSYILPLPWDHVTEYTVESVECYMETKEGGLIKAGKKLSLLKLLSSGKLEVLDGLVRVNVVPKARASEWIADFKKRRGKE